MPSQLQIEPDAEAVARPEKHNGCSLLAIPASTGRLVSVLDDAALVARVMRAYQHATGKSTVEPAVAVDATSQVKSMWQSIFELHHREIEEAFRSGDTAAATAILRDPISTDLFFGFDNLTLSMRSNLEQPSTQAYFASSCLEGLLKFAETIGAVAPFSREQHDGNRHPPVCWEADEIIKRIEKVLGVRLSFPNPFPGEVGLKTARGVVSYRVPQALYQAWRIKQLVAGTSHPRVLELGAGLGRTAYFARQLGICDYTIIDLPFTGISQGYFLGRTLGAENVVLSGESIGDHRNLAHAVLTPARWWRRGPDIRAKVRILEPSAFLDSARSYDLILNADSLTEMPADVARSYMAQIAARANVLLSINHEYNPFTVRQLIAETGRARSVHRHLYALRQGYVEELANF